MAGQHVSQQHKHNGGTCKVLGRVDREKAEGLADSTNGSRAAPALECLGLTSRLSGLASRLPGLLSLSGTVASVPRGGEDPLGLAFLLHSNPRMN